MLLFFCAIAWYGYDRYKSTSSRVAAVDADSAVSAPPSTTGRNVGTTRYSCDGRTYCSQMNSCAEAMYFIAHCPGTKMDGDNDGVPCEQQWCDGPAQ